MADSAATAKQSGRQRKRQIRSPRHNYLLAYPPTAAGKNIVMTEPAEGTCDNAGGGGGAAGTASASSAAAASDNANDAAGGGREQHHQQPKKKEDWQVQRDALKQLGDDAFRRGRFGEAVEHYSAAVSLDPQSAVLLSNRSAAYLRKGDKSKALHDARACIEAAAPENDNDGDGGGNRKMRTKGYSRLAAAQQSLGRFEQALESWKRVAEDDPQNAAALRGVETCREEVDKLKQQQEEEERQRREEEKAEEEEETAGADGGSNNKDDGDGDSLLDDFFNDVDTAASQVAKEKELAAAEASKPPAATNAIKNSKRELGTAHSQIERLLADNYKWRNLNPFYVLDVPHTSSKEEISKRYKALSLLLHPDKNRNEEKAQDAYDEVLKAKAALDDDNKANHCRQLIEQGMIRGKSEWEQQRRRRGQQKKHGRGGGDDDETLDSYQSKAVAKIFAEIEYQRREVKKREREFEQRERQNEDDEEQKIRQERKFDKNWKQEERVEKRIGNWRDFQGKAPKKGKH